MISRGAILLVFVAVLAAGCGGQSADQWIKQRLAPNPAADVVAIEVGRPDERREALEKLAAGSDNLAKPNVVQLFALLASDPKKEPDPMVRASAVRGLGRMTGDPVVPALQKAVTSDPSPYVRTDAAEALGRIARPECAPPLMQVLANDPQEDVRQAAATALRSFKDKTVGKALVTALADPNLAVSYKAWESLRYMTGQDFPRRQAEWNDFLTSFEDPFPLYGHPPAIRQGESQRPMFTKGPLDFLNGLFAKDAREAELQ